MREEQTKTPPVDLTATTDSVLTTNTLLDEHYIRSKSLVWATIPVATKVIMNWNDKRSLFEVAEISPPNSNERLWNAKLWYLGNAPTVEAPVNEVQAKEIAAIIHGIVWSQEANCLEAARRILRAGFGRAD